TKTTFPTSACYRKSQLFTILLRITNSKFQCKTISQFCQNLKSVFS
ncbi:unnamed protein product, partial [Amoebophrya sp. A120]